MIGHLDPSFLCQADLLVVFEKFGALVQRRSTELSFFSFQMQTFLPFLIGPKESEASRCRAAISSWMSETWVADVLFFLLLDQCVARDYGVGVSETERKKRIHHAGLWALFGEGVGTASPHAGSSRCRRLTRHRAPLFKPLLQHHPAMGSGGVQLLPAGQKFSGPGAGALRHVRLHAVISRASVRMAESTSAFWGRSCLFFILLPF